MSKYLLSLPPAITQSLDAKLLSYPLPKCREDCEDILKAYRNIIKSLQKKVKHNIITEKKFNELNTQFLELYGRTAIKEKERESEKGNNTKRPFYYITCPNKRDRHIFSRLKYRFSSCSK